MYAKNVEEGRKIYKQPKNSSKFKTFVFGLLLWTKNAFLDKWLNNSGMVKTFLLMSSLRSSV